MFKKENTYFQIKQTKRLNEKLFQIFREIKFQIKNLNIF